MKEIDRILIVGGGIAGLTLATALHQKGFRAELIERNPVWKTAGAGISVQPNGIHVLRALGLGADMEHAGAVIRYWDFCDQEGQLLCESDLHAVWGESNSFIGIERMKLHQVLLTGAASVPSRLGTSIQSLLQQYDYVSVVFSDGSMGKYDLVVGADGISSTVRGLALNTDPPVYAGHMAWRSIAPIRPKGLNKLQFHLGDRCFFGLCPVGDGSTYGFGGAFMPRFYDEVEGRLERLRDRFSGFGETVKEYLAALTSDEQIHASAVEWIEQSRWYDGRVVLIGDAAHASSPMMGQGGCMAMEDAYVLAEVLSSEDSVDGALDTFVSRRKPRVEWAHKQSQIVAASFVTPAAVRNAALRERGMEMFQKRYLPLVSSP
jgi:FAD-dependent urate hydroxylase